MAEIMPKKKKLKIKAKAKPTLLGLGVISLYPFVRFRAMMGLGYVGFIFWTHGQLTPLLFLAGGSVGLYTATIFVRYIAHKDGGGVQSDRTAREEEQWRQLTMSPEDEANVAQTHHGAEADKGIKADDAEPEQGGLRLGLDLQFFLLGQDLGHELLVRPDRGPLFRGGVVKQRFGGHLAGV